MSRNNEGNKKILYTTTAAVVEDTSAFPWWVSVEVSVRGGQDGPQKSQHRETFPEIVESRTI